MKTLQSIFWLLVLAAGGYVGFLVAPPYFNNYKFQDTIQNAATLCTNPFAPHTDDDIRSQIYKEAQSLGLPLTQDQIHIEHIGPQVSIWANYAVHIDLPYYPFDLNFHPASSKQRLVGQ